MLKGKLIKTLKATINNLEEELDKKNLANQYLQHDCEILLNTSREQRNKIKDLENNIEFLTNNIGSRKLKELVRPSHQN